MGKFVTIFILLFSSLFAASKNYFDIGGGTMPLDPRKKCSYVSVGKKFETYRGSVDLSATHRAASASQNYLSGQLLIKRNLTDHLYVGAGPGVGSLINYKAGRFTTVEMATVEGVVGYELPKGSSKVTPHLQFGVTQPTYIFHNGTGKPLNKKPAFNLSLKLSY